MGSEGMTASNPTIINVIPNIIYSFWYPTPYALDFVQTFFSNPPTDGILFFSGLFPLTPFFAGTALEFGSSANPICKWRAGPIISHIISFQT
jgi:hypothetical protein